MELSLFLAKLLGIYMLVIAAIWLFCKRSLEVTRREILSSQGLLALAGVFSLLSGLAIVIGHPVWEASWRGVITFIGVLAIFKGVMRLGFPNTVHILVTSAFEKGYWAIFTLLVVLGIYLTYHGFHGA